MASGANGTSMTGALRGARLMGWASFGLAAAMLLGGKRIARTFGLEGKETLIHGFAAQEALAGVGAHSVDPRAAMWARAGGDLAHMAVLANAVRDASAEQRRNAAIALAALAGFFVADAVLASKLTAERSRGRGPVRDYGDRSGFPRGAAQARGAAGDFQTPDFLRSTPPLRRERNGP